MSQMRIDQPIHVQAIVQRMIQQMQESLHVREWHVQRPTVANKGKPFQMRGAISSIAVRPPNWRGQEAYPFIITDGLWIHARGLPKFANSHIIPPKRAV